MLNLQRVTVLVGLVLLPFACGEKFTAGDAEGGAGGQGGSEAGAGAGSGVGGDRAPEGGDDTGGDDTRGGAPPGGNPNDGSPNGGRGGISNVGGSGGNFVGGSGGSGGSLVEVPPVPPEGLELWFDANEGVTQVNGVVVSWQDRSRHQRVALQPSTKAQPKIGKLLNGKAALSFDGVDDHLRIDSIPGDFTQGVSIFVIMQPVDAEVCTAFFEASNGREIEDVHLGASHGALLYEVADFWVNPTDHQLVLGEPQLAAAVHRPSQAVELRRNRNTALHTTLALPRTVPRAAFIGYTPYTGCKTLTGSIGEILVYSRGVTDPELIQIESYLHTKWDCCGE